MRNALNVDVNMGAGMAKKTRTEHAGGKNGGGYWGSREEAKSRSKIVRRQNDKELEAEGHAGEQEKEPYRKSKRTKNVRARLEYRIAQCKRHLAKPTSEFFEGFWKRWLKEAEKELADLDAKEKENG